MAQQEGADVLEMRFASLGLLQQGGDVAQAALKSSRGEDGVGAGDLPSGVGNGLGFVDGEGSRHARVDAL